MFSFMLSNKLLAAYKQTKTDDKKMNSKAPIW